MPLKILGILALAALGGASVGRAQDSGATVGAAPAAGGADGSGRLEEVVVTATPLEQSGHFLATIVDSVDRAQILSSGGATLADALANQPGVTASSFAAGASRPVIRGFDANRVRVLEDGIDSFDVSDVGPDHGVPIDPLSADQIEVVRGAATLRYGSQAIGGVVNAINNRIPREAPETPFKAEVTGSYGSNADARQWSGSLDAGTENFAIHADGFDRRMDDYSIPGGTMRNTFVDGEGYALGGSYFFGTDRIGADVVHYDSKYGIPGEATYVDLRQTKQTLGSSFVFSGGALEHMTFEGGHADYEHSERDPASGEVLSTFKDNGWDARLESVFGELGPFSGAAVGLQAQNRDFSALGEGADYLRPTNSESNAVFLFAESPLTDALRLQTGARIERAVVGGTPVSDNRISRVFRPVSASLGIVFDATRSIRVGATLTSAARAPAQTELFARGPHDGPGTFEIGDPTLGIERADSLEGTVRLRLDKVDFEGAVWAVRFADYIYGALTGRTCNEEGNCTVGHAEALKELVYAQQDATFRGAEAKTTLTLRQTSKGELEADFLADYVRATLDRGGNVPRIPPYHVAAGLHWKWNMIDAGFMLRYSGRQSDVAAEESTTPGFASLDAHIDWRPLKSFPGLELALIGRNLTDTVQRNAVAYNKDEVVLPGHDVRLLVRGEF